MIHLANRMAEAPSKPHKGKTEGASLIPERNPMRSPVTRTPQPPLFNIGRPIRAAWTWEVTYAVASSGYPTQCRVFASSGGGEEILVGSAACSVALHDDLREVIECLAIEAMLAACEPTLDGSTPHRQVTFESNLRH